MIVRPESDGLRTKCLHPFGGTHVRRDTTVLASFTDREDLESNHSVDRSARPDVADKNGVMPTPPAIYTVGFE